MERLKGKRALITGACGKMGSEFARAFAAEGASLVLTARNPDKITSLEAEIRELGVDAAGIAADFTSTSDIDLLAQSAWNVFGGIDVVLLSSQPAEPSAGDLLSIPDAVWQQQQMAIAWGPFRLMRQLAPKMIDMGSGNVISITSSTAVEPIPGFAAYGVAKSALETLTRYMAVEWGPHGIRANCICPGTIATGGNGAITDHPPTALLARTALRRTGRNSEVAGAAVYLASDESSFTTGQCIHVNGGRF